MTEITPGQQRLIELMITEPFNRLTPAQQRTLEVIIENPFKTKQEIADLLHISESTINFHLSNIYKRVGINGDHQRWKLIYKTLGLEIKTGAETMRKQRYLIHFMSTNPSNLEVYNLCSEWEVNPVLFRDALDKSATYEALAKKALTLDESLEEGEIDQTIEGTRFRQFSEQELLILEGGLSFQVGFFKEYGEEINHGLKKRDCAKSLLIECQSLL